MALHVMGRPGPSPQTGCAGIGREGVQVHRPAVPDKLNWLPSDSGADSWRKPLKPRVPVCWYLCWPGGGHYCTSGRLSTSERGRSQPQLPAHCCPRTPSPTGVWEHNASGGDGKAKHWSTSQEQGAGATGLDPPGPPLA